MLIVSLDQYIVIVALPDVGRALGYSAQTLQTVICAYAIASSGLLLFGGRAADLVGPRRMLAVGLGLYAVASFAGGIAPSPAPQLAGRVLQGVGGALVFPATLAVINTTYDQGRDRNRALSIWGASGAAGLVVGFSWVAFSPARWGGPRSSSSTYRWPSAGWRWRSPSCRGIRRSTAPAGSTWRAP
jgi:MFS family permease